MPLVGPSLDAPVLIPHLLQPGLETRPDETALVSSANRWTWRELARATNHLAANLLALGLRPGDRVASLMPNRATILVHYIA
jgi:acyl-CoA synthetase (AMP-forming)/AMP-acid ligase II